MRIDIVTIFPEMFETFLNTSIIKRAIEDNKVLFNIIDLRDYANNKHNKIDDTPYGGGVGMIMQFPPFYDLIKDIKTDESHIVLLSPQGSVFNQDKAKQLSKEIKHLIILCGHYEGIDARVLELVDEEISVGDFVLTGGEIPAMLISDAVVRLIPGVIQEESITTDSLEDNLLKYPQYTKPQEYEGYSVPEVLTSGHHENIDKWRLFKSIETTYLKRPDLLRKKILSDEEQKVLDEVLSLHKNKTQ